LGEKVQDRVSKFEGIAVYRVIYLQGCNRIGVQPEINDKGELPAIKCFDEPDLIVIGDGVLNIDSKEPEPAKKPGGPHDHGTSGFSKP
jgi:hypothetical protein